MEDKTLKTIGYIGLGVLGIGLLLTAVNFKSNSGYFGCHVEGITQDDDSAYETQPIEGLDYIINDAKENL